MVKNRIRKGIILLLPLLAFFVLLMPYRWCNSTFLVNWLGCGCPQVDAAGNLYEPVFNANDFTLCFWLLVTAGVTGVAVWLSHRISRRRWWLRWLYVVGMLGVSLELTRTFYFMMQWN